MTLLQITCLTLYAAGIAVGQLLFKSAADAVVAADAHTFADQVIRILKLALDPIFLLAIALYVGLSVLWVWILSFTPLTRAYPFAALALVFTVLVGVLFFRESLTRMHLLGLAFIFCGVLVIARA